MKRYKFDPSVPLHRIAVVGLGGTGSQLARSIARLVYDMRERRLQTPELMFIDPDKVELKNVGRQMFTVADEGQYKAELLAQRFNRALGLEIIAVNSKFKRAMLGRDHEAATTLLVGCVDNPAARRAMASCKTVWLDTGNHYDSGQVVLGNAKFSEVRESMKTADKKDQDMIAALPTPHLVFPGLLEDDAPAPEPDLSCADLVQRGEQHLFINEYVALAASQYVYRLLHRQPISSHMSYVSADTGMIKPVLITDEILKSAS